MARRLCRAARKAALALLVLLPALAGPGAAGAAEAEPFSYEVSVDAPPELARLLRENLEAVRRSRDPRVGRTQARRLYREAEGHIRELLSTEGYYSPEVESGLETAAVPWHMRFRVVPGAASQVGRVEITVRGPMAADAEEASRLEALRAAWGLPEGRVFRHADWERAKRELLEAVRERRYAAARIARSEARVDPARGRADLTVEVDSGRAFDFGGLRIEGLQRYPEATVANLSPIEPGSPYDAKLLRQYRRRLLGSEFFATAAVRAEADPAGADEVPVDVSVQENRAQQVGFAIGYSTDRGPRAEAEYRHLNLLGKAWRLDTKLAFDQKERLGRIAVTLPPMTGGWRDSLELRAKHTDNQGEVTDQFSVAAGRGLAEEDRERLYSLRFDYEQQSLLGAPGDNRYALSANYALTLRDVEDPIYPDRGYLANFQSAVAPGMGLSSRPFARLYGRAVGYLPTGTVGRFVLRGDLGWVLANSRSGIPSAFLFKTGGDTTVRGYAFESLGVREGEAVVGGRYLAVASVEYVLQVSRDWGVALFTDVGDAVDELSNLDPAVGYGAGLRWRSPVGPLNLDMAYGERDRQYRFHFTVGVAL